jgi:hypothetical protein
MNKKRFRVESNETKMIAEICDRIKEITGSYYDEEKILEMAVKLLREQVKTNPNFKLANESRSKEK